jgi:hypothetical protein
MREVPMKRFALLLVLAACAGEAERQPSEPATAAPTPPSAVMEPQRDTASATVPPGGTDAATVGPSEVAPGSTSESYESCMARVNHGGDGGAGSASCAHLADAPR